MTPPGRAVPGEHAVDEDARCDDALGVEVTDRDDPGDLRHGQGGRRRHHRPEVAGGLAIDQVAHGVGDMGPDQGDVTADGILQHVVAAVDGARLLSLGQRRADPGRAEEGADPRAGGSHPLSEVALRNDLEVDLPVAIEPVEDPRGGLSGE